MKNKIFVGIISIVFLSFLVGAVPQVIFSEINITITNGSFHIIGEGIDAQHTFECEGGCEINYTRNNIPITFSRNIGENTDVAILINALAENINITNKWEECLKTNKELEINLTLCDTEGNFEENYGICKTNLNTCETNQENSQGEIKSITDERDSLKKYRTIFIGVAVLCGFLAFYFHGKSKVKTIRQSSFDGLPIDSNI